MATLNEISIKQQQLEEQLKQLENDKNKAAQAEREEKLGLITAYQNEAQGYRNQAVKAESDTDKQRLYGFAERADRNANELRVELGLISEEQFQATTEELQQEEKNKVRRKINGLLIKAAISFLAYLISDYSSSQLELGFICYALNSIAQICYCIAVVYGGCWLVGTLLFGFVSTYAFTDITGDFRNLSSVQKLFFLAALLAAILHFLASIIPDGI
ncbi:hypothetical protein GCM10027347_58760 [Larkinella harenae]